METSGGKSLTAWQEAMRCMMTATESDSLLCSPTTPSPLSSNSTHNYTNMRCLCKWDVPKTPHFLDLDLDAILVLVLGRSLCVPSFVRYLYGGRLRAINASMQVIEYWILMTPGTHNIIAVVNCRVSGMSRKKCNALATPGAHSIRSRRSMLLSSDCHWRTAADNFQTQTLAERLTALWPDSADSK